MSVSSPEVDVSLVFAAMFDESTDLIHSSSRVSIVLTRTTFTLRLRGSANMESTHTNPIITFTPRLGKPHCRHPHQLLHCESTFSSVINATDTSLLAISCSCLSFFPDKCIGEIRTKSPWLHVNICQLFQAV